MAKQEQGFQLRPFVSILTGFAFLVMAVSGIVLFFSPSGRTATATAWTIWGLDRYEWIAFHIWFSVLAVLVSIGHLYLNYRAIIRYFQSRITRRVALRPEWIAAFLICMIVSLGVARSVPPFNLLMNVRANYKPCGQGGAGRGPRWSREPLEQSSTGTSASTVVRNSAQGPTSPGGGMGRTSLGQFCANEGIALPAAIELLRQMGIDAQARTTMRLIADQAAVHPRELRTILSPPQ